jgi:hypothetical protein
MRMKRRISPLGGDPVTVDQPAKPGKHLSHEKRRPLARKSQQCWFGIRRNRRDRNELPAKCFGGRPEQKEEMLLLGLILKWFEWPLKASKRHSLD